ncbi:winged helix-turn-helix transcriptional regulator [Nonomuraea sp. H19]|uniref:winged helix-turn-helix transcriptional regulator n=1 Tax=Nonomuraea sp. H19 TaxID=3452206 RepID=UPI003F8B431E
MPGRSRRVLAVRLRQLAGPGLVQRMVDEGPPTHVSYHLTDQGEASRATLDTSRRGRQPVALPRCAETDPTLRAVA